jgi:hypothetical protein
MVELSHGAGWDNIFLNLVDRVIWFSLQLRNILFSIDVFEDPI